METIQGEGGLADGQEEAGDLDLAILTVTGCDVAVKKSERTPIVRTATRKGWQRLYWLKLLEGMSIEDEGGFVAMDV